MSLLQLSARTHEHFQRGCAEAIYPRTARMTSWRLGSVRMTGPISLTVYLSRTDIAAMSGLGFSQPR